MVDKSEKVVWLARLGFAVRGLVYLLLGYLALSASSLKQVSDGPSGMLEYVQSIPGGTAILYLCALGLLGYATFKLIAALYDTENHGTTAKGAVQRVAYLTSALVYVGLAWTALQLAIGSAGDVGDRNRELAQLALSFPVGPLVLGLIGLGLLGGAGFQAKQAVDASFMKTIAHDAPPMTCWIGRAGLAARAVVFLLVGWSLMRSAWFSSSSELRSIGQALLDLREMGAGYTVIAAGIALFGVFSLITARYRIIPDPEAKLRRGPSFRAA